MNTTDGRQLTGVSVENLAQDPQGDLYVAISANGINGNLVAKVTASATADQPAVIQILAGGGGTFPSVTAALPATSVVLTNTFSLAALNSNDIYVSALGKAPEKSRDGVTHLFLEHGQLVANDIGIADTSTFALDRAGDLFFNHTDSHGVIKLEELMAGSSTPVPVVGGGSRAPGAIPIPENELRIEGSFHGNIGPAFDVLSGGDLLAAPGRLSRSEPIWFRGTGKSETEILGLLHDAKVAAAKGQKARVRVIYDAFTQLESTGFVPTPQVIQNFFRESFPRGSLPADLVNLITKYLHLADRHNLLMPLRARLAKEAMRAEIPNLALDLG